MQAIHGANGEVSAMHFLAARDAVSSSAEQVRACPTIASIGIRHIRVRFLIIRNARTENVCKSQSCMFSKLRIIWKRARTFTFCSPKTVRIFLDL